MDAANTIVLRADACLCAALDLASLALGAPVEKAAGNVLTPKGFDHVVLGLLAKLKRKVYGPEKKALAAYIYAIEHPVDSDYKSWKIEQAAEKFLGLTKDIAPSVVPILRTAGETIAASAKAESAKGAGLSIAASLDAHDRAITDHMVASSALYVRDQYGARSEALSAKAREIVAAGVAQGLDRFEIVKRMRSELNDVNFQRSDAYYGMVVEVFAQRARTYGTLRGLQEAGAEAFEVSSLLSETTCETCRFMDGKVFGVRAALDRYDEVAAGPPESVAELQPWLGVGKDDAGNRFLYFKRGGEREVVSQIVSSAAGQLDQKGVYAQRMSDAQMQAAGLGPPPYHARCVCLCTWTEEPAPRPPKPALTPATVSVSTPPGPTKIPVEIPPLLDDILAQVRPLPRPLGVDQETLPPAAYVSEADKVKAALAKLAAMPPNPKAWTPGKVLHGEKTMPPHPTLLNVLAKPWDAFEITSAMISNAKKASAQDVDVGAIVFGEIDALPSAVKAAMAGVVEPPLLVKKGGVLYTQAVGGDVSKVLAHKLLGKSTIQAKVIDLDAPAKKKSTTKPKASPKPKSAPVAAPISPTLSSDTILGKLVAPASGSNPGGIYEGADGIRRYVKFYSDPSQAHAEHLANEIYAALGHGAPKSILFEHDGKTAYASEIVEGRILRELGLTDARAKEIMRGFVADTLLANWDVVGVGNEGGDDNVLFGATGKVFRIDSGGSLLFTGLGLRKNDAVLDAITEWDKFFDPAINFNYARVAAAMGVKRPEDMRDIVAGEIKKVLDLRAGAGSWAAFVAQRVPTMPPSDRARVAQMLEARTRLLEEKLRAWEKPPARPWPGRYVEAQKSTVKPRAGLRLADLPEVERPEFYDALSSGKTTSGEDEIAEFTPRARKAIDKADAASQEAITRFTSSAYATIRTAEAHSDEELRTLGWSAEKIKKHRGISDAITRAFDVVDPEPGTVYRGIKRLPTEVHRLFLESETFALGAAGKTGTTSSSWSPNVAIDDFMHGPEDHEDEDAHKILFVFRQKSGIPIQTISELRSEREILLRRDVRFRTTGLGRLKGTERVLVVEAEEIEPPG